MAHDFTRRPARLEDFGFARELYLECVKPLLIAIGRWDEEKIPARFAKGLKLEQMQVIVTAGADIGWIQVSETEDEVHIDQIHLVEGARNEGVGTSLVRELQDRASAANKALALNVIHGNRAQELYERLGFRVADSDEEKIRMIWRPDPDDVA